MWCFLITPRAWIKWELKSIGIFTLLDSLYHSISISIVWITRKVSDSSILFVCIARSNKLLVFWYLSVSVKINSQLYNSQLRKITLNFITLKFVTLNNFQVSFISSAKKPPSSVESKSRTTSSLEQDMFSWESFI